MDTIKKINAWVETYKLLSSGQTIIVGLSGGPDSVFLLHYLVAHKEALKLNLIAAHLDHEWRADSGNDTEFCKDLAEQLQVPYVSRKISELDKRFKQTGSKEQDARTARRYFLEQIAQKYNANVIALAQHKDDQEETFFIRLLRGATLTGLTGMWPKRGIYIRPLLCITKTEILDWLKEHDIAYLTDPTNESLDYLRNRIRMQLLPTIKQIDPRFNLNFSKTIGHLQQTELFLQKLTEDTFNSIASFDESKQAWIIDLKPFLSLDPVMHYRILIHWLALEKVPFPVSQAFFDEMMRFFKQPESKSHAIHEDWHLVKKKQNVYIQKNIQS